MTAGKAFGKVGEFLAERFPTDKLNYHSMVEKKAVPLHRMSWAYYLGGLTLFFFMIQVCTGLLLLFYYQPTPSEANLSIDFIMNHVAGGALIRNLHAWSSSLMIFFAIAHLVTAFAMKSFEKPRELTWLAGMLLLFITFTMGFTGYLLPWNQIAVNATKVGLQSVDSLGQLLPGALSSVPHIIKQTFQGEASVGQTTLLRFYALHVVLLPLAMAGLLVIHLLMVQLHGMSKGTDAPVKKQELFFPFFLFRDIWLWSAIFVIVFVVALCIPFESFLPFPLLEPYDPLGSTPSGIKPEWYFYFLYYPLELLPFSVVVSAASIVGIVLFFAPWIFKKTSRRALQSMAILGSLYFLVSTIFGQQIYEFLKK
jgi:cytochrome b6